MVDAMGVTGTEGVFRKAAEISYEILRNNSESLMSVLEAFVHDPLVEWANKAVSGGGTLDIPLLFCLARWHAAETVPIVGFVLTGQKSKNDSRQLTKAAESSLKPIERKLGGLQQNGLVSTVPNQVDDLIQQATSYTNLALMYQGWAPWL
jgi:serine/threonine-protein kinase ATR